jgi:hypothetical protein
MQAMQDQIKTTGLSVATYFFGLEGRTRPELDALSSVTALSELILTPEYFCSQTIKVCPAIYEKIDMWDDILTILSDMPADAPGYIDNLYQNTDLSDPNREKVTFIHFSDAHLDLYYEEGAVADCGSDYCCRSGVAPGKNTVLAGKWGAVTNSVNRCDVPMITIQSALQQIKSTIGYSDAYLFWTGDNTAHDKSTYTESEVFNSLKTMLTEVQTTFEDKID